MAILNRRAKKQKTGGDGDDSKENQVCLLCFFVGVSSIHIFQQNEGNEGEDDGDGDADDDEEDEQGKRLNLWSRN